MHARFQTKNLNFSKKFNNLHKTNKKWLVVFLSFHSHVTPYDHRTVIKMNILLILFVNKYHCDCVHDFATVSTKVTDGGLIHYSIDYNAAK